MKTTSFQPMLRRIPHAFSSGRALALALAVALAGCADSAGDPAPHVDELPRLEVTEELRIGSVTDPDVGFSRIGGVAVDHEGNVYVLEQQDLNIRVYDASGTLLRTIGREGGGPGEFRSPGGFGLIGDTLWVADRVQQRLSLFTRDGEYLHGYSTTPVPIDVGEGLDVRLMASGLARDGTLTSSWMVAVPRVPPSDTFHIPIVRMDTSGAIIDTLRTMQWWFPPSPGSIDVGGMQLPVPPPPSSMPLDQGAPDGGYFAIDRPIATGEDVGSFTVTRIAAAGDTAFTRTFRYTPRGFSDAMLDSLVARYTGMFQQMGADFSGAAAQLREAIVLPPFQPPIASAEVGRDGSLWLERDDTGTPFTQWLVLNADGTARGVLELPRRASIHQVDGDVAWVALPDDLDVPWLVKYRVHDPI